MDALGCEATGSHAPHEVTAGEPRLDEPLTRTEGPRSPRDTDWYEHWGLTHFLRDGHHKLQGAAETGRPLRSLSLLSVEGSLAKADRVARVPELRARPRAARPSRAVAS